MFEALQQHAWQLVLLYLASGIVSLILANKSQIDGWANAHPRAAGILKLMRGLGLDPWLLLQSLSLLILGRLPSKPQDPPKPPPTDQQPVGRVQIMPPRPPVPPGSAAMVSLFVLCLPLLVACSSAKPLIRDATRGYSHVEAVCILAQTLDGKVSELEAATSLCSNREFLKPWRRKLKEAADIVEAQRAGKPDVDPPPVPECAPPAAAPAPSFAPSPSATP